MSIFRKKNKAGRMNRLDTINYWHNYYLDDGNYYFVSNTEKGKSVIMVPEDTIRCLAKGESIEKNCDVFMRGWSDICIILSAREDLMDTIKSIDNHSLILVIFGCGLYHNIMLNDDFNTEYVQAAYDRIYEAFGNVGNDAQNWFKGFASALYDAGSQVFLCPQMMKIVA